MAHRRLIRAILPGPDPGEILAERTFGRGTRFSTGRLSFSVQPPPQAPAVRRSAFSGSFGPRHKIDWSYADPFYGRRRHRAAMTRIGLTFLSPRGAVSRQAAGGAVLMRPRPRYVRVLPYPRGDREPQVYDEGM